MEWTPGAKNAQGPGLRGEDIAATDRMLKWDDREEAEGHSIRIAQLLCETHEHLNASTEKDDDNFFSSSHVEHGYAGQFDNGHRTIPSFCPFCLHNKNLSPAGRISAMTLATGSKND